MTSTRGRGIAAFCLATAGVLLAGAFTLWALTAAVYSDGGTLLGENPEFSVRLALAAPLALAGGVWLLLHHACRYESARAKRIATCIAWMLVAFSFVTGFSIGMFVMPVAAALVAAASLTPVRA